MYSIRVRTRLNEHEHFEMTSYIVRSLKNVKIQ